MGDPVKIVDLAHNMIRLSGKEPERDIPVEFIGARPGEKLKEELWGDGETSIATAHPKILRATSAPIDPAWLDDEVAQLARLVDAGETVQVVARLTEMMRAPRRSPAGGGRPRPRPPRPTPRAARSRLDLARRIC